MYNVLVVDDGNEARDVELMFRNEGYDVCDDIYDADVVVFVGGEDVNPALYECRKHHTTFFNDERDKLEIEVYRQALSLGIPMAGICRGGQLLNVLSGGQLWQDVNNHNSGRHPAYIHNGKDKAILPVEVTSVHHQMMEPDYLSNVQVLLTAGCATKLTTMSGVADTEYQYERYPTKDIHTDVEACYYPDTKCLCFQPHPEYGHKETKEVFFMFMNNYLFQKENDNG